MTTSHLIGGNFVSDFPKDSEAEADDKIVIDKLLINKLTELLINSIYSVHISRRSEIFLTSLDMHLAENSGVAELGYDEVVLRASKITHI
jgi:hypothetical protein